LLEGVGVLLLVNIFTGKSAVDGQSGMATYIAKFINVFGGDTQFPGILPFFIALFGFIFLTRFGLLFYNGFMSAVIRRKIQESIFTRYLLGDWSYMRNVRVGDAVATNTLESMFVTKYLACVIASIYYILSAIVLSGMAIVTSFKLSIALGVTALPLVGLIVWIFNVGARISKRTAELRVKFSGDITDRFNGLLQVHVDNNYDFHVRSGIQTQKSLMRLEVLLGVCNGVTGSFGLLMILSVLIAASIWVFIMGSDSIADLALIAGVSVLGMRSAANINMAIGNIGNISRMSGSLYPVIDALNVPSIPERKSIDERIERVEMYNVSYAYGNQTVINEVSITAKKGFPLVLSGRSGMGKTTLANLFSGLYFPSDGEVTYHGISGNKYDSTQYRPRVGFVTQDVYLFQSSLRSNLSAGRDCTDEEIWATLEQVDAAEFVRDLGGLDTESAEAGRSLSGGQRRRLGIARVLLSGSDILIFDEVASGLDQINKSAVLNVIERLSETYVVIVISHEDMHLSSKQTYSVGQS